MCVSTNYHIKLYDANMYYNHITCKIPRPTVLSNTIFTNTVLYPMIFI